MNIKHEWRKKEKALYLAKAKPEVIDVPCFNFLTIQGEGNPNQPEFNQCVEALYSLAYGIKMQLKRADPSPEGYTDYTVYPLEGVWDITPEAQSTFTGVINKDDLVYTLMIRQPDFVSASFFDQIRELVKQKKPLERLDHVKFESLTEGTSIQMLHQGPFDNEPVTFETMEAFAATNQWHRTSKVHREIYLSDPRKVSPDKYKTVLRFQAHR
ncbi:GyrI-like domain-containing protein [Vibrio sp. FNV 38]|nr:GyrI-like domain-containing protein [Vibrio sp. FNV 38]